MLNGMYESYRYQGTPYYQDAKPKPPAAAAKRVHFWDNNDSVVVQKQVTFWWRTLTKSNEAWGNWTLKQEFDSVLGSWKVKNSDVTEQPVVAAFLLHTDSWSWVTLVVVVEFDLKMGTYEACSTMCTIRFVTETEVRQSGMLEHNKRSLGLIRSVNESVSRLPGPDEPRVEVFGIPSRSLLYYNTIDLKRNEHAVSFGNSPGQIIRGRMVTAIDKWVKADYVLNE